MLFIKNGNIKTMAGSDIPNGCILIGDDGKIAAVGEKITPPADTPATGDSFQPVFWTSVMVLSAAAVAVLLVEQKKRRTN